MLRNEECWCGSGRKYKKCHLAFDDKLASMKFDFMKGQVRPPKKIIKNAADIEGIRQSGVINDAALDLAGSMVKEGIDTLAINDAVHEFIVSHGAIPACLDYEGYPKSICISLNDVVCHGIPSKKTVLKEGDILNIDITTILNGYYADASRMFIVGKTSPEAERLVHKAEYYLKKAEGYQREAAYYTRKGDADRAKTYTRWSADAMDNYKIQMRYADNADDKAADYLKRASRLLKQ